jgi:uncharacterized membrane protein
MVVSDGRSGDGDSRNEHTLKTQKRENKLKKEEKRERERERDKREQRRGDETRREKNRKTDGVAMIFVSWNPILHFTSSGLVV